MNRYRLAHVTELHYDGPVSESYNVVRLRPFDDERQSCLSFRLQTQPTSRPANYLDPFGNHVYSFNVLAEHRLLRIEAHSIVHVQDPPALPADGLGLEALDAMREDLDQYFDFLEPTTYVPHPPALVTIVEDAERSGGGVAGFGLAATTLVHDRFLYKKGATHVHSTVVDSLESRAGVCQDFAHILLAVMRMRGIPARYVSGYLVPIDAQEQVIGGQASHAWIEMFVPGVGWFGLDATLGAPVGPRHVRIAYGRDYADAAPASGVYKGHAGQHLFVDVGVRPALGEDGRERLDETAAGPPESHASEHQQQQQ